MPTSNNKKESMEERFDKRFGTLRFRGVVNGAIKSFIRQEINAKLDEVVGEMELCKNDVRPEISVWLKGNRETNEAENAALSSAIEMVNKFKE